MSTHDTPISPLRQRIIEDMMLRKLSPKTQSAYIRWIKRLAKFLGRSPDTAAAETLLTIAADPEHLGARIGLTAVLHTWGSALTHHPHVHCIVPGGGISLHGERWVACRRGFFLPVRVLSRLFRRLFCEKLTAAHRDGKLRFFGEHTELVEADAFAEWLRPPRKIDWVLYAKRPFAGPEAQTS
jgi:hypothetical protein